MNNHGFVYILTNPSFREDCVKIWKSTRPVDVRSKELDNTAVPLPFEIYATLKTSKYEQVEKLVHKTIDRLTDLRIRPNREFFNVQPHVALDILKDVATTYRNVYAGKQKKYAFLMPAQVPEYCRFLYWNTCFSKKQK